MVDALVDHVEDAVPFERIARKAKAQGVELAANTLASSVHAAIDHLDLIANEVFRRTMISHVVGIDATSMPTLDPKARGGIRRMALWNLLGDSLYSSFGVASSGHGDKLKALLKGHSLQVLQCDGSPAINEVQRVSVVRAGCHSHARSKLVDALKTGDHRAAAGLSLYADLFAVEAESRRLREQHPERLQRRAIHSGPLIARLWAWVDAMRPQVEPRSPLGAALTYMTRQRATLEVFLKDGRVAMKNNAVERELRTYVLDRKTWLFCGHAKNAERIAAALTIVRTCKLHGIDSRAYLRVILRRILAGERDMTKLWMTNVQGELAPTRAA